MKIDLHCHTKAIKSGEVRTRNVTTELFKEKVESADVKMLAVTNHNIFDLTQYEKLRDSVKKHCLVLPGIELDVCSDIKPWHLVIVCDDKKAKCFNSAVLSLTKGGNPDTDTFKLDDIITFFDPLEVIFIPHHYKEPSISDNDFQTLSSLVNDKHMILSEPSSMKSLGILDNHGFPSAIGSDVHDWNKYEECTFSDLRLGVDSFHSLKLLLHKNQKLVDDLLSKQDSINITVFPHETVNFDLEIYNDINIFFGHKGTGKTKILESICNKLNTQQINYVSYIGARKNYEFKKFTSTEDIEIDVSEVNADLCQKEFKYLLSWKDINIALFSDYTKWAKTKEATGNRKRLKILNTPLLSEKGNTDFKRISNDYKNIIEIEKLLNKIKISDYIKSEKNLVKEFNILKDAVLSKYIDEIIDIESTNLANSSINLFKEIVDKKTGDKSKPSTTGFTNFASSRLRLRHNTETILENLNKESKTHKKYIGTLDSNRDLHVETEYRMLCDKSTTNEFKLGIQQLRKVRGTLNDINTHIFEQNITNHIDAFVDGCKDSINSTKEFLGIRKYIVDNNGNTYKPSEGEEGMILLEQILNKTADAYIIDEPELGMGNSYIEKVIRPKLSELAKKKKIVVVATHNANIAVRTIPYNSVYRSHNNNIYSTYVGNPFSNTLINLENEQDTLNWRDVSLVTLEGGEEAFYGREKIYSK